MHEKPILQNEILGGLQQDLQIWLQEGAWYLSRVTPVVGKYSKAPCL